MRDSDEAAVARLVRDVVCEVYGDLIPAALEHRADNWRYGLLAAIDDRIVAVVVADDDWIEDLWVAKDQRRRRGHDRAHLRVVARNLDAQRFYAAHGWAELETYPHEGWGFTMIEMVKALEA